MKVLGKVVLTFCERPCPTKLICSIKIKLRLWTSRSTKSAKLEIKSSLLLPSLEKKARRSASRLKMRSKLRSKNWSRKQLSSRQSRPLKSRRRQSNLRRRQRRQPTRLMKSKIRTKKFLIFSKLTIINNGKTSESLLE